jgi:protein TonB
LPATHAGTFPRPAIFGWCLAASLGVHAGVGLLMLLVLAAPSPAKNAQMFVDLGGPSSMPLPAAAEPRAPAAIRREADIPRQTGEDQPASAVESAPADTAGSDVSRDSLGWGMASGYFSSIGEGKSLRDDIRAYYFDLLEHLNTRWWRKAEGLGEPVRQEGIVEILIGRDGTLHDLRFVKKSSSREVNRAIIEVLTEGAPYPPLPAGYGLERFRAPLRLAAPSKLFRMSDLRQVR